MEDEKPGWTLGLDVGRRREDQGGRGGKYEKMLAQVRKKGLEETRWMESNESRYW